MTTAPEASRWRAGPRRLAQLMVGLVLFGVGEALVVLSDLGSSPWIALSQGAAVQTPLGVGVATVAISFIVLLAWFPLHQRPGLGTILNAIVVGLAIDATLTLLPGGSPLGVRLAELVGGIALVGVGSGYYLSAALGPGPRDGLMTGLVRRTGGSVRVVRTCIEVVVVMTGWLLGGTLGLATVLFVVSIGPLVHWFLPRLHVHSHRDPTS